MDRWTLTLDIAIRRCRADDLSALEWFGQYSEYRRVFEEVFELQTRGDVTMLVAEANDFPVGQVWINWATRRDQRTALIFALRVLRCFRNMGIGTRLMGAAEGLVREAGYSTLELGVEHDNVQAKRLYERLGFRVVDSVLDSWSYTRPDGSEGRVEANEWVMRRSLA